MKSAEAIREKWLNKFGLSVSRNKEIGRKIHESAIGAMKEYAEQAIDRCAEKAEWNSKNNPSWNAKKSIIEIKSQLK